jgi:mono/diheme cytochrome c family protein
MHRLALRSLVLAATALLMTTSACDAGDTKADGAKQADAGAADAAKVEDGATGSEPDDDAKPDEVVAAADEAGAAADEAGAADAGEVAAADDGAEPAVETGEAVPAAGEEDGDDDEPEVADKQPPADKPPADKEPVAAKIDGKPLFESKCKSCHGIDGAGDTTIGKKVEIPSLVKTKLGKAKVISTITDGVPDTKMKAYKDKLSKDEIDAIAVYVKKL